METAYFTFKQLAPAGPDDEDLQMQMPTNEAYLEVPSNPADSRCASHLIQTDTKLSLN